MNLVGVLFYIFLILAKIETRVLINSVFLFLKVYRE